MLVCEVELDLIWDLSLKLKLKLKLKLRLKLQLKVKLMALWMILNLVKLEFGGFDFGSLVNRVERDIEGCNLVEVELQF